MSTTLLPRISACDCSNCTCTEYASKYTIRWAWTTIGWKSGTCYVIVPVFKYFSVRWTCRCIVRRFVIVRLRKRRGRGRGSKCCRRTTTWRRWWCHWSWCWRGLWNWYFRLIYEWNENCFFRQRHYLPIRESCSEGKPVANPSQRWCHAFERTRLSVQCWQWGDRLVIATPVYFKKGWFRYTRCYCLSGSCVIEIVPTRAPPIVLSFTLFYFLQSTISIASNQNRVLILRIEHLLHIIYLKFAWEIKFKLSEWV